MNSENPDEKPSKLGFFDKNPSLRIREFNRFLTLRFGIIFALNMQSTTIYYWVYHITNDKLLLGLVGLAEVIPAIGFSFISGHFVDLNEKRKMVMICLIGYILLALSLFLVALPSTQESLSLDSRLYFVYFFVFLGGMLRSCCSPSTF